MRTNIDIDDTLMESAMRAGPYKTKKDAVEAGLALLARQAAYREILKWEGKLQWDGDEAGVDHDDSTVHTASAVLAREPGPKLLPVAKKRSHGRR
ncbi:MAG: type II toxin-antitoxin system VapB family antitoxin [Bdellovibrionales bacterium]|nr:type II toxin-antitoxin system VapB family antitoxin [Massilia sp.]